MGKTSCRRPSQRSVATVIFRERNITFSPRPFQELSNKKSKGNSAVTHRQSTHTRGCALAVANGQAPPRPCPFRKFICDRSVGNTNISCAKYLRSNGTLRCFYAKKGSPTPLPKSTRTKTINIKKAIPQLVRYCLFYVLKLIQCDNFYVAFLFAKKDAINNPIITVA